MPRKLERKLWKAARKKHMGYGQASGYVYGTLRKAGWIPKHERRAKRKKQSQWQM